MSALPIHQFTDTILAGLAKQRRLVLSAPTGSGKSTRVPQMLLDHGWLADGQAIVLQPRRLAARLLAARVAAERGEKTGQTVGYQIRFDDISSAQTKIKYVTEGILLRRMLGDPSLRGISTLVFDEFHERHIYSDLTLARARQIQESFRPDLNIIVMSATLDTDLLARYLAPCETLSVPGRTFPVTIGYDGTDDLPVWDQAAHALARALPRHPEGDVLIFMPGVYEISRTISSVQAELPARDWIVLPLHGELPPDAQDAAVARYEKRKVIVSTNVAETSITIDGIRLVVDAGLARVARFDPHRGINTLLVEKISRASADQRAGRAGRTAPGHCLRLWTEKDQQQRAPHDLPEIKRIDLSETILTLKASGILDVGNFPWVEPPEPKSLERALILLTDLGALAPTASDPTMGPNLSPLTPIGRQMVAFPAHPRYARMLLASRELGCVRQAALIAALTQSRNLLLRAKDKKMAEERDVLFGGENESDFFTLMRAWRYAEQANFDFACCQRLGIHVQAAREVRQTMEHFLRIAEHQGLFQESSPSSPSPTTNVNIGLRRCLLLGFSDQLARRCDTGTLRCDLVHGRRGLLARDSVVENAPLLVAAEIRETERHADELVVILGHATAVEEAWLQEFFPDDFRDRIRVFFDATTRRVVAHRERVFRDLVLGSQAVADVPKDQAAELLAEQVLAGTCPLKHWDDAAEQFVIRVNRLVTWCPELEINPIDAEAKKLILTEVCRGALGYKDIKERPVLPALQTWLSREQANSLQRYAPERWELPNGRKARIIYPVDGPPTVGARIQDLYGVKSTPMIAMGRAQLVLQILAPSNRPIQVTQDLASFWKETYPKLRPELSRNYPKHEWR